MSADEFEDAELLVPLYRFRQEGIGVDVASTRAGHITGKHLYSQAVDKKLADVNPHDYDVLVLPGGRAPASLRDDVALQGIVRAFDVAGKPIAAICHGPQILVSPWMMEGRTATGYRAIASELKRAGAHYLDQEVVVDGNLVTSREPSDLPAFCREMMKKTQTRRTPCENSLGGDVMTTDREVAEREHRSTLIRDYLIEEFSEYRLAPDWWDTTHGDGEQCFRLDRQRESRERLPRLFMDWVGRSSALRDIG